MTHDIQDQRYGYITPLPLLSHQPCTAAISCLSNLSTDSTGNGNIGVDIRKESAWVLLDLRDVEVLAGVNAIVVEDTSLEWALQGEMSVNVTRHSRTPLSVATYLKTANADAVARLALIGRVRESDTWWAGLAADGLMDVRRGVGGGLVGSGAEAGDLDVVADEVLVGVDTQLVVADGAGLATSGLVVHADDLVGRGLHGVGRGELPVVLFCSC